MSAKLNFLLGFEKRTKTDELIFETIFESNNKVETILSLVP